MKNTLLRSAFCASTLLIFSACSHSLPHRDLHPEEARAKGYILGGNDGAHRGAVAGYVPHTCSRGGWGLPCNDSPVAAQTHVTEATTTQVVADSDNDGVNDTIDQCKNTPHQTKVNAFGCPVGNKTEIRLNVRFASGSAKLDTGSLSIVDHVAAAIRDDSALRIRINGHTDSSGDAAKNMTLSEARAKAVAESLVARGVKPEQLSSKGFGPTQPIADNKTAKGRSENRRVTAELLTQ